MKRTVLFVFRVILLSLFPIAILYGVLDSFSVKFLIIAEIIIFISSLLAHSWTVQSELGKADEKIRILSHQNETHTNAYQRLLSQYNTLSALSEEQAVKLTKSEQLKDKYFNNSETYLEQIWRMRKEHEELKAYESKYIAVNNEVTAIQAKLDEFSKNDLSQFHRSVYTFLFPDKELNCVELRTEYEGIEDFYLFRRMLYKRLDIIEQYESQLKRMEKGLENKRYSPYIYTTLAEAYANRIIADWYTNNFNQNEMFPPIARISAELQTLWLTDLAQKLDWGDNKERAKKVKSIQEIKRESKEQIESANIARYQLEYLLALYPQLQDVLDVEYNDLNLSTNEIPSENEHDTVRDYLSKEEYAKLSETERNQLALDRYVSSHSKTKWQIGRDYELYIGYLCEKEYCEVEYTGSTQKLEDLGRDLIVHFMNSTYIIQCKYWSNDKVIREKHIMQLFGTVTEYRITHENDLNVKGVFVTRTKLSETAKKFAEALKIDVHENVPMGEFPRIKCNINTDMYGDKTYIYHLPIDLSYDVTKIDYPGEFMAFTVKEAEEAGFRRSYKWHGTEH